MAKALLLLLLCVLAGSCLAQPASQTRPSLEALIARADNVFLGTPDDMRSLATDGNTMAIGVHVGKVLKGSATGHIGLLVNLHRAGAGRTMLPTDVELLWFTTGNPHEWAMLDIRDAPKQVPLHPDFPCLPVFGMDLKPVSERSDVLARARAFIEAHPGPVKLRAVEVKRALINEVSLSTAVMGLVDGMMHNAQQDRPGIMADRVIVPVVPTTVR